MEQESIIVKEGIEYDRISAVANWFKSEKYIEWIERTKKRERTMISNKALKVGLRLDELIKTGEKPNKKDSEEVHSAVQGFQLWSKNYAPRSIVSGKRLFNEQLQITGEPDFYVNDEEIDDLKGAKRISLSYWLQLGGYYWLPNPIIVKRLGIIRATKGDEEYEYKTNEDLGLTVIELGQLFLSALNIYRFYKKEK